MDYIEINKIINRAKNNACKKIKPKTCCLCGKEISHCCNSHTIPQFILNNLDDIGEYYNYFEFMEIFDISLNNSKIIKNTTGKNNTNTFKLICNDCDCNYFREYENANIFNKSIITNEIMAKICKKNILFNIYIESINKEKCEILQNESELYKNMSKEEKNSCLCYLKERKKYSEMMIYNLNLLDKRDNFSILYQEYLPYTIPIAFQNLIRIEFDLKGNIINNLYSLEDNYEYKFLNVCIFPYKNKSLILVFYDNIIFDNFKEQIKELSKEEIHKMILYFIFQYNDDFIISKNIKHQTYVRNKIKKILEIEERDEYDMFLKKIGFNIELLKHNIKNNIKNMPNILGDKYKLEEENFG